MGRSIGRSIVAHLAAREERNRRARRDRGAPRPPVPAPRRPSASCVSRRRSLSDSSGRATRRRAASPRRRRAATTRRRRRLQRSFRLDWFFFRPPCARPPRSMCRPRHRGPRDGRFSVGQRLCFMCFGFDRLQSTWSIRNHSTQTDTDDLPTYGNVKLRRRTTVISHRTTRPLRLY